MARLDKFIQALHDHGAERIVLAAGKPASLVLNGGIRPITKDPLSGAQVVSLVRELAPAPLQAGVTEQAELSFSYTSPAGPVQVELSAGAAVAIVRDEAAFASAPPAQAAAPLGPRFSQVALAPELTAARARMDSLLRITVESHASDLHLRTGAPPILRKDGELVSQDFPALAADEVDAMLVSIMGPRELNEYRESGDSDWAYEIPDLARFRANAAIERRGPMGVFRVIPSKILTAEELGLSAEVQKLCYLTKGLVLVTGPTGSGKSTTLSAMVDLINRTRTDHILTIEDPIEFVHVPKKCVVSQRQVGFHTQSFKNALRAALREDPDVILVGEMRDLETVSIAIETAETGHLVLGTLHTTTAASTVDRIIDQFPADRQSQIRVMLSESLKGVIAQVLCRKVGGGRIAAKEILLTLPAVANLIREGKTFQIPSIMQTNRRVGMVTLNDALMELVEAKLVEPKEAYVRAAEKASFASALKTRKFDTSFLVDVT